MTFLVCVEELEKANQDMEENCENSDVGSVGDADALENLENLEREKYNRLNNNKGLFEEEERESDEEEAVEEESQLLRGGSKRKRRGRKSPWEEDDIDDLVDIVLENETWTRKLVFENTKKHANQEIYASVLKVLADRLPVSYTHLTLPTIA